MVDSATATTAESSEALSPEQKKAVAATARAFSSYEDSRKAMARIAKAIVTLRLTFLKDKKPDYRGETAQYRGAITALYESAIPDPEERAAFKVSIRYWVGKEFAARVEDKSLKKSDLEAAGILKPTRPAPQREPRRASSGPTAQTGITVGGKELSPEQVLAETERVVMEHATDDAIGPVMALQSISRVLGPVVAGLRNSEVRDKLPGRALKQAVTSVLNLALDAAVQSGVDVDEFVADYHAKHAEGVPA